MESPAPALFLTLFLLGQGPMTWQSLLFLMLWEAHYLYRAFVYPFLGRNGGSMPASVALLAFLFNLVNAYLNGRWLFHFRVSSSPITLVAVGVGLFLTGLSLHVWADHKLRGLRRPGSSRYQIPRGGLFRHISCPNYLGELLQWVGWALLTFSLPGTAFALWTAANLGPRALAHHRWYCLEFPDYPERRRSLIPFII
jgi:protein-S-isoprenylcysteine O-methyltransferase Ste14